MEIEQKKVQVNSETFTGSAQLTLLKDEDETWRVTLEQSEESKDEDQDLTHFFTTDSSTEEETRAVFKQLCEIKELSEEDIQQAYLWYV